MENKTRIFFPSNSLSIGARKRLEAQTKLLEQQAAQIDYIAMMSDIDITGEETEVNENEQQQA